MSSIVELDLAAWRQMPVKYCGLPRETDARGACVNGGRATTLQIVCEGRGSPEVIGLCGACKRYVCGRCALSEPAPEALGLGRTRLACRYCGLPLGTEAGSLLITRAFLQQLAETAVLPAAEPGGLTDAVWTGLYKDLVRRGVLTTAGLRAARTALRKERYRKALRLLTAEDQSCREAGYEAGLAHCATQRANALILLERRDEARPLLDAAASIWRRLGNRGMLAQALFSKYFLDQHEDADPETRLAQLRDLHKVSRGTNERIFGIAVQALRTFYLNHNDLVNFARVSLETPETAAQMDSLVELYRARTQASPREAIRARAGTHDQEWIRKMRETHDVWGCPEGCRLPGTLGLIGFPKGQRPARLPCMVCGTPYVCLNNYSPVSASVPDWSAPGLLTAQQFPENVRPGIAIANLSLLLRDDGRWTLANELQDLSVEVLARELGGETRGFAQTLNFLARALQAREEHESGWNLCHQAAVIAEALDPPQPEELSSFLNNAGLSLACLGDFDEAERTLQRSVEAQPESPFPYYWLAKVYAFRGHEGDAGREAQAWRGYLARTGGSEARRSEARGRLAELEPGSLPDSAQADEQVQSHEEAAGLRARLRESVHSLADQVQTMIDQKTWDAALPYAEQLTRSARPLDDPEPLLEALMKEGRIRQELGDEGAAVDVYKEVEALSRKTGDQESLQASLLFQSRLLAHSDWGRAIELATEARALNRLQIAKLELRSVSREAAEYRRALEDRRSILAAMDQTGLGLLESGQLALATALYEELIGLREAALDDEPADPSLRMELIVALENLGTILVKAHPDQGAKAARYFQQALNEIETLDRGDPGGKKNPERIAIRNAVMDHLGFKGV